MKKIVPLFALALSCPPLAAQVDYDGTYPWSETTSFAPDNAVPGWFYNLGITGLRVQLNPAAPRTLVVKHVFAGTPAAGQFSVNDVITGVEGQPFTEDHQDGYGPDVFGGRGPLREFGIALDAVQGTDGTLSVTRLRNGNTSNRTLTVGTTYGSYSPTFPVNCPKSDLILSQLLTYLRQTQSTQGSWPGVGGHENHIFAGLALLSDGSAASMTAAGKLATYYKNETNAPIPADNLNNWKYLAAAFYLSEYYHKTNDATVLTKLNTLYGYLLASQYTDVSQIVPGYHGDDPFTYGFGGWGHNPGYEGYGPIAMLTGQGALALSLMDRVGVNVDRTRLDAAYAFLVKGTGANHYVWYADQDGSGGNPDSWADPGRTGASAIANWMSPYAESAYAVRAINHARFMGDHPQSFPDTHGSPTIGMAYAAMGTHIDPSSFRKLLDEHLWWFSLAQTPEGNFYYQPNRDNTGYGSNPRFQASSVAALILSLPKRNLMISESVFEMAQASFSSPPAAVSTSAISMTATTVNTDNGPMEYLFTETSGNPGGTGSTWQTSPTYTDTGLSAGTQYSYTVAMRDALGVPGPASAPASATTQQGQPLELMVLNFHAYGNYATADRSKVTLESAESAGVGPYNVSGWQNYAVPWNPGSPAAPFTLTSNLGATATFTLKDVRNGWTFDDTPNTNVTGGNADLMNSHANGTEDPYDGSMLFDMEVTGIPYNVYDLIVYMGANQAQFGDGTGKLVLNGGPQQNFTRTSGEFSGFTEISNATIPGNYIIFRGLRNPSLTLRVWGNGFNHIGPSGFQIVKDASGVIPPGPAGNPYPPDGSVGHAPGTDLSWTGGLDAVSRNVYFGTNPTPGASELKGNQTATTYDPGNLADGTYYWRIDEVNADGTTPGPVWSFTVGSPAKAFRPMPWNGMTAVATDVGALKWVAGESATASSHGVYFGTDSTPDASEFIGNQSGTTFNPGTLSPATTYYWRIDQVNAQGTTTGDVWSFTTPNTSSNKVKIFILAGQSNMEGQGEMNPAGTPGTLQTIYNNDPVTYAHLKTGGNWTVRDDAWIWYKREGTTLFHGGLTAGYGANSNTIGPELQFGHAMGDYYGQKVLLIKTAWGGKSLRTDFRPPGSGWSLDEPVTDGDEGFYFKQMLDAVVDATANLQTYFPTHNPADGYEIAGFAWHQGWNDRVTPAFAAEYEANMAKFIRDVRSAVGVPAMPFVIATTGMDGTPDYSEVELAQLQMDNFTAYPDFEGNVAVVDTQSFWFPPNQSPADQGYHWNRHAGTYYEIGESIAAEMQTLLENISVGDTTPPTPNPATFASAPAAGSDTSTSMTATIGNDPSGPVQYLFTETSGNPGGTTSGWQTSPSYTDSGLDPSTQYTYTVTLRDALGNTGTASIAANATTNPPPGGPTTLTAAGDWATGTWSNGVPGNGTDAAIAPGVAGTANNAVAPWSGSLTLNAGSSLSVGTNGTGALTNTTTLIMKDATIFDTFGNTQTLPAIILDGGGAFDSTTSSDPHADNRTFAGSITGTGGLSIWGNNRMRYDFNAANNFTGGLLIDARDRHVVAFNATGSAGAGNVTVDGRANNPAGQNQNADNRSAVLRVAANDIFAPTATLTLNGAGWAASSGFDYSGQYTLIDMQGFNATVAALVINGVVMPAGTYSGNGVDNSDAANPLNWIRGTGTLTVGTPQTPYEQWFAGPFPSGQPLTDPDPELDFDGGSLPTGIEWIVGGDPTNDSDDAALAPAIQAAAEPGFHTITYRLGNEAAGDSGTDAFIEYSTNLTSWTRAIDNGDTIRVTTSPGGTFATVEVKLKDTLAPEGRIYARLKATINP
jgi:hypothetical protein